MILDDLKTTNEVILDSITVASEKQSVESFNKQLEKIDSVIASLIRLLDTCESFQKERIISEFMTRDLQEELLTNIENCETKVSDRSLNEDAVQSFKYAVDHGQRAVSGAWTEYFDRTCAPVIGELSSLRDLFDDPKSADALTDDLNSKRENMPKTSAEIDRFQKMEVEGREAIEGLNLDSDPQVRSFVDRVGSKTATVEDLTPNVIEWLDEHHLKDKIRLTFRS